MMREALRRFVTLLDRLGRAALALLFLLGIVELAARAVLAESLGFAVEYGGYLLIAALLLPSGEALLAGRHIRIALLAERLPRVDAQALALAADLVGLFLATLLCLALAGEALASFLDGARSYFPSATPLHLPQAVAALGAAGLVCAFLLRLLPAEAHAARPAGGRQE